MRFYRRLAYARPCPDEVCPVRFPEDAWTERAPAAAGIDPDGLADAVAYAEAHESTVPRDFGNHEEIFGERAGPLPDERGSPNGLVVHEGAVVAEWGDTTAVDLSFSVTKSVLSLCAGVAYDEGLIDDVDDRVADYVDDGGFEGEHNGQITWRHLLQNTSEWGGTLFGKRDRDDRREGLNRELEPPGTFYEYNDVRVNRLSLSLLRLFGRELPDVFHEAVMDPIGATDEWAWYGYEDSVVEVDGERLRSVSGGGHWGGGFHVSSRDLARIGHLALNRGAWDGERVLSEAWFRHSLEPCRVNHEYGFMWWLNTERDLWPRAPADSFAALGYGSNVVWVDPGRDLVAVLRWFDRGEDHLDEFVHRLTTAVDGPA